MRRAETSITGRSLHHCRHSGVDDEVGRDVGHYAVGVVTNQEPTMAHGRPC